MAWYKTGTVSVTNGSTTVTGSGTNFVSGAQVGEAFQGPDGELYEITTIGSSTSLTLASAYGGSTASGQSYAIVPTQSLVADLASDVADLISDYQTVVDEAGAGKFTDGSAASPAIKFTQDQDTGFFRDTANEVAVSAGGSKIGSFSASGLEFLDNKKAVFGAGSDLQIYHDGTNSYVRDAGTGKLLITTDGDEIRLLTNGTSEFGVRIVQDGAVKLYHDNVAKLDTTASGIDVTGTLTSTGVDVTGAITANDLTLSDSTPTIRLNDEDGSNQYTDITQGGTALTSTARNGTSHGAYSWRTTDGTNIYTRVYLNASGQFTWYDDANNQKMRWNSVTSRLGIGTLNPSTALELEEDGQTALRLTRTNAASNYAQVAALGASGEQLKIQANTSNQSGGFMSFEIGGSEAMRLNNSGDLGINNPNPSEALDVVGNIYVDGSSGQKYISASNSGSLATGLHDNTLETERGFIVSSNGLLDVASWASIAMRLNRMSNDGNIISFHGQGAQEGAISISGTTVSYNGGHLARWSRLPDDSMDATLVKGTVMTNLDEMVVWHHEAKAATYYEEGDELPVVTEATYYKEGDDLPIIAQATYYEEGDDIPDGKAVGDVKTEAVYAQVGDIKTEAVHAQIGDEKTPAKEAYTEDNEQLNKMAVSSVEGDPNVAGVFVSWDYDDDDFNDMHIAMTGDMVIRIAQGTTVERGDLLMSAGDGTAKPQGDDIVRSKTIAKVTSTNVSHTYDDGSYLVPCVLMAC